MGFSESDLKALGSGSKAEPRVQGTKGSKATKI
jgi:hypothetical protein